MAQEFSQAWPMTTTNSERFLRAIQERAWRQSPPPNSGYLWRFDRFKEAIAKNPDWAHNLEFAEVARVGLSQERLLNSPRYEDPHVYRVLSFTGKLVQESLRSLGRNSMPIPLVGSARTRRINALSIRVESEYDDLTSPNVVVIDSGLLRLLSHLPYHIFSVLPITYDDVELKQFRDADPVIKGPVAVELIVDPETIRQRMLEKQELLESLAKKVVEFVISDYPLEVVVREKDFPDLTWPLNLFPTAATIAAQVFILGHEFGHAHLGHLGERRIAGDSTRQLLANAPEEVYRWDMEYAADTFGLEVAINSHLGPGPIREAYEIGLAYFGCDLFFWLQQLLEMAQKIAEHGSLEMAKIEIEKLQRESVREPEKLTQRMTHPPSWMRRIHLQRVMTASTKATHLRQSMELAKTFRGAIETLKEPLLLSIERLILSDS
jgi:hypothetical protein